MLEESASSLSPTLWESMNSWFTPTVLFILLNVMIATIFFTSSLTNQTQKQHPQNNDPTTTTNQEKVIKSPSLIQRLKSINLYTQTRSHDSQTKPSPDSDTLLTETLETNSHYFFQENTHNTPITQTHYIFEQTQDITQSHSKILDFETPHVDKIESFESQSMDEVYTSFKDSHFTRTKSDTEPASGDIPVKLPAKMRKSASSKSAFGHFEAKDVIEARRPATVKERGNKVITEEDEEVDAKADDFINKFKQQLKLQRLDSIIRYKDMIGRGSGVGGK